MSLDADLMSILLDAVEGLPNVARKRMFGLDALWADGRIFALVANGRIALKDSDLATLVGSRPFAVEMGKKTARPARWFFVPESFHDDPHELRKWARKAYDLALAQPLPVRKRRSRRA